MSYLVEFEPEAISDLGALDQTIRERIISKIDWLAKNFDQLKPQSLTGDLSDFFKLRVGDYRVLYDFSREDKVIAVIRVKHRREVYL
ncbi:type II toxin-antitoxin system RelE/ParE family toxin [Phormidesmis priestleyi ULC007]|uniref:Type II toxin-antitoxin system RelE/ParE family toxin n=1 Tax=Phormidesmis priestleyi ULC007 TaxID=1920490 RepID=A0A2T1D5S9_9CYAN|nr:type II toxin-antitoxin system RelE/ParE family toxin [Phormidesmis priestleyi]PSB15796.1 type II toxin-antitoxin system RelE/ParE family toxin [Phormidesmis priestleyi ULC007]PZO46817.1 MAG: type II toxin-antitoxin system RelE/ParE family toxin [Phormidesmis priestleyi]